jgi:hypothetical protein
MADRMARQAAGAQGYPGAAGAPGAPPRAPGQPPGLGQAGALPGFGAPGANTAAPDFSDAVRGAESFLAALERKDTQLLAQAVAIRGKLEASTEAKRQLFKAIEEENLPQEDLDELARAFEGMKVINKNTPKSSARVGVIVGKQDDNKLLTRTLTVRREKDGWKVQDYSGQRTENIGISKSSKDKGGDYGRR